jgi:phage tail sheath protein FI
MPISNYQTPGIYMEEVSSGAHSIHVQSTSTAGFIGQASKIDAYVNQAIPIDSYAKFAKMFVPEQGAKNTYLSLAVRGFFENGGRQCYVVNIGANGSVAGSDRPRTGIKLFDEIDDISMVAAPGMSGPIVYDAVISHCENNKYRVAVTDFPAPSDSFNFDLLKKVATAAAPPVKPPRAKADSGDPDSKDKSPAADDSGYRPRSSDSGMGATYYPWLVVPDPCNPGGTAIAPPSGHMMGIWAKTDALRGVHKAPANEVVRNAVGLAYSLTDAEQAELNPLGINCIRRFNNQGIVVWGARTIAPEGSNWPYLNVRRLLIMIEKSILESTSWVVFEPNDESLWKRIRRDVSDFLTRVHRDGALMGTAQEAFFVKCDRETNPPENIDAGVVTIEVGVAPVKPAEFVVFRIGQRATGSTVESL